MFEGLVLHTNDLYQHIDKVLSDKVITIAVIGGNKSSLESAGACAMAGKRVHWLIREHGAGPGIFLNAKLLDGTSGAKIGLSICGVQPSHHIPATRVVELDFRNWQTKTRHEGLQLVLGYTHDEK